MPERLTGLMTGQKHGLKDSYALSQFSRDLCIATLINQAGPLEEPANCLQAFHCSCHRNYSRSIDACVDAGVRLKRGLLMCRHHTVAPKAAFPLLTQKQLATRTVLEVLCGAWKRQPYSNWQKLCVQVGDLVPNELTAEDEGYISP